MDNKVRIIRLQVQECKKQWVMNKERSLEKAVSEGNYAVLSAFVSKCKPRKPLANNAVYNDAGVLAAERSEIQGAFRQHFAKVLAGKQRHMHEIVTDDFEKQKTRLMIGTVWFDGGGSVVPGVSELAATLAATKVKALAEDRIGGELMKIANKQIAKKLHPLITKSYESAWFPPQLKGGHLFALLKKGIRATALITERF
jgi:hypothetical protein